LVDERDRAMHRLREELEVLWTRVAEAQTACDAALAASASAQNTFDRAIGAINEAAREGNSTGDRSEARRLQVALQASDLRERRHEAARAAAIRCEELEAAVEDLAAALLRRYG
jgi:hypothetical protein